MITVAPPKTAINSRRDQKTLDRLQMWAEKKGWRSLAHAQEMTSNMGLDLLEFLETAPEETRKSFHTATDLVDHIESQLMNLNDADKRAVLTHFNVKHTTRYNTQSELQKQVAVQKLEIERLRGAQK